jgi:hypothetical protein
MSECRAGLYKDNSIVCGHASLVCTGGYGHPQCQFFSECLREYGLMRALSIRQPWAYLIVGGMPIMERVPQGPGTYSVRWSGKVVLKDIENRTRPTKFRSRVYVHASKQEANFDEADPFLLKMGFAPITSLYAFSPKLGRQVILGEVDIVDCVTESKSPWFTGPYGWVLANPVLYDKPIPCKGKQGFFIPEIEDANSNNRNKV